MVSHKHCYQARGFESKSLSMFPNMKQNIITKKLSRGKGNESKTFLNFNFRYDTQDIAMSEQKIYITTHFTPMAKRVGNHKNSVTGDFICPNNAQYIFTFILK